MVGVVTVSALAEAANTSVPPMAALAARPARSILPMSFMPGSSSLVSDGSASRRRRGVVARIRSHGLIRGTRNAPVRDGSERPVGQRQSVVVRGVDQLPVAGPDVERDSSLCGLGRSQSDVVERARDLIGMPGIRGVVLILDQ